MLESQLVCVALCQGAALHFVDGENGVKDFDVWTFYAARPNYPAFPWRRRAVKDFGEPRFGRSPDKPGFVGRHVDLLGRSIEVGAQTDPAAILRGYLSEGRTASARALARKAAVLLEPSDRLGTVVWPPEQGAGTQARSSRALGGETWGEPSHEVELPESVGALERVRTSFRRRGLMRLLGAEPAATLLQTVSLSPVRGETTGAREGG